MYSRLGLTNKRGSRVARIVGTAPPRHRLALRVGLHLRGGAAEARTGAMPGGVVRMLASTISVGGAARHFSYRCNGTQSISCCARCLPPPATAVLLLLPLRCSYSPARASSASRPAPRPTRAAAGRRPDRPFGLWRAPSGSRGRRGWGAPVHSGRCEEAPSSEVADVASEPRKHVGQRAVAHSLEEAVGRAFTGEGAH